MKSIRLKILLSFSVILLLFICIFTLTFFKISSFNHKVEETISKDVALLIDDENLSSNIQKRIALIRGYALFGDQDYKERFLKTTEESKKYQDNILKTSTSQQAKDLVNKSIQWRKKIVEDFFPEYESGRTEVAKQILIHEITPIGREIDEGFSQLAKKREEEINKSSEQLIDMGDKLQSYITIFAVSAIILGIIFALIMAQKIVNPILLVVKRMKLIANGDLSEEKIKNTSKDEIGQLILSTNHMQESLQHIIKQVGMNSEHVTASAEELTASAEQSRTATEDIVTTMQDISINTDNETSNVKKTSLAINEMSVGIQQIATSSDNVSNTAIHASEKAMDGNQAIQTAVRQMKSINQSVNGLAEVIGGLENRSKEIGQIVDAISDIAAQTNLLALNAAIEAARAGEHGRGFSVVADEVRNLAVQSAISAQQISQLVETIQRETGTAVTSMEMTTKEVDEGINIIYNAGNSFYLIEESINEVSNQIQEVSAAIQQMTAGAEQIVQSIETITLLSEMVESNTQKVSAATEEQLASMEEITISASSLSKMAVELQELIGKFQLAK